MFIFFFQVWTWLKVNLRIATYRSLKSAKTFYFRSLTPAMWCKPPFRTVNTEKHGCLLLPRSWDLDHSLVLALLGVFDWLVCFLEENTHRVPQCSTNVNICVSFEFVFLFWQSCWFFIAGMFYTYVLHRKLYSSYICDNTDMCSREMNDRGFTLKNITFVATLCFNAMKLFSLYWKYLSMD